MLDCKAETVVVSDRPRRRRGLSLARLIDFQQFNPLRPVTWRWELAGQLVDEYLRTPNFREHAVLAQAVRFRRALGHSKTPRQLARLARQYPALTVAHSLHFGDDNQGRWRLEAQVLSGRPVDEVSERCNLPPEVVAIYEALFFDVADRLRARDYIQLRAIGMQGFEPEFRPDLAMLAKALAYAGGPLVLDTLIEAVDSVGDDHQFEIQPVDLTTPLGRRRCQIRLLMDLFAAPLSPPG